MEMLERWGLDVTILEKVNMLFKLEDKQQFDMAVLGTNVTASNIAETKLACQKLKKHTEHLHLLINSTSPNLREALIGAGASSCQTKPISPAKLGSALLRPFQSKDDPIAEAAKPDLLPLKVLAVDDNEANLKLIKAFLSEQVREIKTATNGKEAVEICNQEVFNLIFMDIQMPIMDGITACQRIGEASLNEITPIIAVTAHAMAGEKEKLLQMGFSAYLTKPLDEEILRDCIFEFCAERPALNTELSVNKEPMSFLSDGSSKAIDWNMALTRAGGKEDLAKDMLDMMVDSLPSSRDSIQQAQQQDDKETVLQQVHKLHGACCYTGVPKLKQITEQIETRLKRNDSLNDLEPELFELFDEIEHVLEQHASFVDATISSSADSSN